MVSRPTWAAILLVSPLGFAVSGPPYRGGARTSAVERVDERGVMSTDQHQVLARPRALRRWLVLLAVTVVAITGLGPVTPGAAYTYATPDMSCMEAQYEFGGPVRPSKCRAMTLAVARPNSDRPRAYRGHLRRASWTSWNHDRAFGRGQVQTHRQGWVDIRIKLSQPRRFTYNLTPKHHRWVFTQFRFKFEGGRQTRWLKYDWTECDSFSSVYC